MMMKRNPPIATGDDAKRFVLRSKLNELQFKLAKKTLSLDEEQKAKKRIAEIEEALKKL